MGRGVWVWDSWVEFWAGGWWRGDSGGEWVWRDCGWGVRAGIGEGGEFWAGGMVERGFRGGGMGVEGILGGVWGRGYSGGGGYSDIKLYGHVTSGY